MAFVLKTAKTLRNNWKKSTFGLVVLSYSVSSAKNRYDTNILMRACCEEAAKYGEEKISITKQPRSLTVILNPAANKRKAKTEYEKYCDPLLHLAGIGVTVLQTNSEGHAKELVESLPENETIVIAGGDGTFCETITGLLRKDENNNRRIVGILPLGRRNYIGSKLFPGSHRLQRISQLTDATMAIIKNETKSHDVMKIEAIESEAETPAKPIFAIANIEWGAFRDAIAKRDKYWIYGRWRDYATYIFNGYKSSLSWDCKGTLRFTPPCDGCNNCRAPIITPPKSFSWIDILLPKVEKPSGNKDYSGVFNEKCNTIEEICFKTTELNIIPREGNGDNPPHLNLTLGKMGIGYFEFVKEGWKKIKSNDSDKSDSIKARSIELLPLNSSKPEKEIWFNIDNEEFDVKPIKITLLPKAVNVYCKNN